MSNKARSKDSLEGEKYRYILAPGSRKRQVWHLLLGVMLSAEALATPFVIAFDPPISVARRVFRSCATVFWSTDVVLTFFTGFEDHGDVMMEPSAIAKHYFKTWLSIDLFSIVIDILFFWIQNENEVKFLRLSRAVRLLRLFKLRRIFHFPK